MILNIEKNSSKKVSAITIAIATLLIILIALIAWGVWVLGQKKQSEKVPGGSTQEELQDEQSVLETENIYQTQNYSKAVSDIERKIKADQETLDDVLTLGVSYYNLGKYDEAIDAYNQALGIDPQNIRAYVNLGNTYRDKAEYRKAEENYRKALSLDPSNINIYSNLAVMFMVLENNKTEAIKIINEGLAKNPGNEVLQRLLSEYQKM